MRRYRFCFLLVALLVFTATRSAWAAPAKATASSAHKTTALDHSTLPTEAILSDAGLAFSAPLTKPERKLVSFSGAVPGDIVKEHPAIVHHQPASRTLCRQRFLLLRILLI